MKYLCQDKKKSYAIELVVCKPDNTDVQSSIVSSSNSVLCFSCPCPLVQCTSPLSVR